MPSIFGLCDDCAHQRVVGNTRGSRFSLCGRSRHDDRFPRYPRMPVAGCVGFERREAGPAGSGSAPESAPAPAASRPEPPGG